MTPVKFSRYVYRGVSSNRKEAPPDRLAPMEAGYLRLVRTDARYSHVSPRVDSGMTVGCLSGFGFVTGGTTVPAGTDSQLPGFGFLATRLA